MASPIEAMDAILSPMIARYQPPRGMKDPTAVITEYAVDLERFTRPELEKGWEHLRQTHARQTWPHFSEILTSIKTAMPKPKYEKPKDDRFGDQREYWWNHAENAPAYAQAVAQGVPLTFRNMAAKQKRWPQERDIGQCKAIWEKHVQLVGAMRRDPRPAPVSIDLLPGAIKLGAAIIEKNNGLLAPFPPEME